MYGVAEHNGAYTLPNIAEAMSVGNWFDNIADDDDSDEIKIIDGYFSIEDEYGILISNEECFKIVKGWFMQMGNLSLASSLGSLRDTIGTHKITGAPEMFQVDISQKQFAKLNRLLNKVKK